MAEAVESVPNAALTPLQRHLYAAGHFAISLMGMVITLAVLKYYFPDRPGVVNLVPPLLAPYILTLGRFTDGLNDPIAGYLSDNLRTRWGRRKPFMAAAVPVLCVLFVLIWYPPAEGESALNFWHGALVLVFFFVAFTLYVGPYTAMLSEVAQSVEERLKLSSLQGIYNVSGLIAAGLLAGFALKAGMSHQGMAWLVAGISLVCYCLPLFGPRDDPTRVAKQEKLPLFGSIAMTLRNRPFRIYVITYLVFLFGLLIITTALPYISEKLLNRDEGDGHVLAGIALLAGALWVPWILRRADRLGSKAVFLFSLRWLALTAPLLSLMVVVGDYPWGIWVARGLVVLPAVGIAGLFALPYAILSGVTDHDRRRTGLSRQGMFFCVQGMVLKLAYSGGPMVVGWIALLERYEVIGFTLVGPLAAALALAAHAVFRRFPEEEVLQAVAAGSEPTPEAASGV